TGFTSNTNIGISSGGDNYTYRISLARRGAKGVYPLSHLYRKQVGFNGQIDLSDKVTATVSGNFNVDNQDHIAGTGYDNVNVFQQFNQFGQRQIQIGPNSYGADYQRPDGTARGWNWKGIEGAKEGITNFSNGPWWERHKNYANMSNRSLFGRVMLTYDISKHFALRGQLKTDYYNRRQDSCIAVGSQAVSNYTQNIRQVQETNAGVRLNYVNDIGEFFTLNAFVKGLIRYNNEYHNAQSTQGGLVNAGI